MIDVFSRGGDNGGILEGSTVGGGSRKYSAVIDLRGR